MKKRKGIQRKIAVVLVVALVLSVAPIDFTMFGQRVNNGKTASASEESKPIVSDCDTVWSPEQMPDGFFFRNKSTCSWNIHIPSYGN